MYSKHLAQGPAGTLKSCHYPYGGSAGVEFTPHAARLAGKTQMPPWRKWEFKLALKDKQGFTRTFIHSFIHSTNISGVARMCQAL